MKRELILPLVLFTIVATPASALAVDMNYYWWNYLQNNNAGLKGVASDFSVLQLHPGHENYLCLMESQGGSPQAYTAFAWQITDALDWPYNRFDCNLHVQWPSGAEDIYNYWVNMPQWQNHRLKVDYQGNGVWYLYLDGNNVMSCNWPYYSSVYTKARTQFETNPYDNPYSNFGHAYNIWVRSGVGAWGQQGSSWSCTPYKKTSNVYLPNPFNNRIIANYWDWEAKL